MKIGEFLRQLLFLLLLFLNLKAEYLVQLNDSQESYRVGKGVLYLEDKNSEFRISEMEDKADDFIALSQDELSFGFTPSTYWFKIPLEYYPKRKADSKQWWIDIDYTLLDDITIYQKMAKDIELHVHTGDAMAFDSREVKWRTYSCVLDTSSSSVVYVRVQTQSSMQVPIHIYSSEKIAVVKQSQTLFYGFFYGVLILIIFYNLFLFIVWNDKNYLHYLFFISSFVLWRLSIDGLGHQYIWPDVQWLADKATLIFIGLTFFNAILFTRGFLHLQKYAKTLNTILIGAQYFSALVTLASFFLPYTIVIKVLILLVFVIPVMLLYAGIKALEHKYRYARFYVAGWTVFLGASVLFALNKLDVIGGYEYIRYFQPIGSLVEVAFFSLALAERINILRQNNIKTLSRLNAHLQSEVYEKVSEIREKDELLIQQSRLAGMGEMLENIAHQWKQPLHKLSLVIQNHYFKYQLENGVTKEDIEKFNEQSGELIEYMSSTVDDFRNFFNPQKESEEFLLSTSVEKVIEMSASLIQEQNIQININNKSKALVRGYPNEFAQVILNLFSNAKDAFIVNKIKKKEISISIFEDKTSVILEFLDNAGGISEDAIEKVFDPYFTTKGFKEGSGIGLYMSKMIIEKSMHGKFLVENSFGGAQFSIKLPKVL